MKIIKEIASDLLYLGFGVALGLIIFGAIKYANAIGNGVQFIIKLLLGGF